MSRWLIAFGAKIEDPMAKFILLGGVLALLAVGSITLAKIPKQAAAQHHEPIDPAILTTHLQRSGEMALP
jgi:hypothetical protein